jgi:putative restriction endonuclease
MNSKEQQFHQAIVAANETAKRECKYNANYFVRLVADYGALGAAKRLLASDKPAEGFATLYLYQRLDLSLEAYVIKPQFRELFTPEEIAIATKRLQDHRYKFDHE